MKEKNKRLEMLAEIGDMMKWLHSKDTRSSA